MNTKLLIALLFLLCPNINYGQECFTCDDAPVGTIFCDDFESGEPLKDRYFEGGGNPDVFGLLDSVGRDGSIGIRIKWKPGQVGAGGLKKSFGKTPSNYIGKHAVNPKEEYDEIYWRLDLRTQEGWQGGGAAKLSRAMTLAKDNWSQGMIAHIWSGGPNNVYLGMDPATGISKSGKLVSTKYNDFNNLRWLGWKHGNIDLFTTENSNKWYCVVAHAKLNTPGKNDGIFEFWINDTLQAGSYDLNWHGNWNSDPDNMKINAIFIENYWNSGSPVEQERYFDNFVISTKKIECACNMTTSVDNKEISNVTLIYPNPAHDYINIEVSRDIAVAGYKLELFDTHGKNVMHTDVIKNIISSHNISAFKSGIYYYKLSSVSNLIKGGNILIVE